MKKTALLFALLVLPFAARGQTAQLFIGFNVSATGGTADAAIPPQVDSLNVRINGVSTTASWSAQIQTSPDNSTWSNCGSAVTAGAGASSSGGACTPSGAAYTRVLVTAGSGGGSLSGALIGNSSLITYNNGGGGGATFPATAGVVCNTSTTASVNCNATQITTALGYTPTKTVASGTATLGTSAIGSGACASVVTVAATGVLTTDNISADFNADPTSTLGYEPGAMLTIVKYPTAGDVNFKVCNNTGSSVTPGAVTLNWRVTR